MSTDAEVWVVDRIEGRAVILVSDGSEIVDVDRASLPPGSGEGTVLRVPRGADGELDWSGAAIDDEAIRERGAAADRILAKLRKRDPGGDIAL